MCEKKYKMSTSHLITHFEHIEFGQIFFGLQAFSLTFFDRATPFISLGL